jgi:hypothetical protein
MSLRICCIGLDGKEGLHERGRCLTATTGLAYPQLGRAPNRDTLLYTVLVGTGLSAVNFSLTAVPPQGFLATVRRLHAMVWGGSRFRDRTFASQCGSAEMPLGAGFIDVRIASHFVRRRVRLAPSTLARTHVARWPTGPRQPRASVLAHSSEQHHASGCIRH